MGNKGFQSIPPDVWPGRRVDRCPEHSHRLCLRIQTQAGTFSDYAQGAISEATLGVLPGEESPLWPQQNTGRKSERMVRDRKTSARAVEARGGSYA